VWTKYYVFSSLSHSARLYITREMKGMRWFITLSFEAFFPVGHRVPTPLEGAFSFPTEAGAFLAVDVVAIIIYTRSVILLHLTHQFISLSCRTYSQFSKRWTITILHLFTPIEYLNIQHLKGNVEPKGCQRFFLYYYSMKHFEKIEVFFRPMMNFCKKLVILFI